MASNLCAGPATPQPVSFPPPDGQSGAGGSFAPAFSADQRYVAFLSTAPNLAVDDASSAFLDLFVWEVENARCRLVSANYVGASGGNGHSHSASLSSNAQWIAFASGASDLVGSDLNQEEDIFLRDMDAELTHLVTEPWDGQGSARGEKPFPTAGLSRRPLISADGSRVFFESYATNLVAASDTNRNRDVFMRHRVSAQTILVSRSVHGSQTADRGTELAGITPDGHRVLLVSEATDLMLGPTGALQHVFVRDVEEQTTWWVTEGREAGLQSGGGFLHPSLSADGERVVFMERRSSPPATNWVHHEVATGQDVVIATNASGSDPAALSADGRHVAFTSGGQVWLWHQLTASNRLISVGTNGAPASGRAHYPLISGDGSVVLFLSDAPNLVTNVFHGASQVLLRDWVGERTELISVGESRKPSGESLGASMPALCTDGSMVAFESRDPGLVSGDQNQASDIFLRRRFFGATTLVSQRHANRPPHTGTGLTFLEAGSVSADGSRVALASLDSSLGPFDTNRVQDVFVVDLATGQVHAVPNPGAAGGQAAVNRRPVISADGRFVAYAEQTEVLTSGAPARSYDTRIRWCDLFTGECRLVDGPELQRFWQYPISLAISADGLQVAYALDFLLGGQDSLWVRSMASVASFPELVSEDPWSGWGNGASVNPTFTPDDQWIVFQSLASDLTTDLVSGLSTQVFARHLPSRTTRLLSYDPDGVGLLESADGVACSGNSRYVAFHTAGFIHRHDLQNLTPVRSPNVLVCSNCSNPSLDFSGDRVAYVSQQDASGFRQIALQNLSDGETRLVSISRLGGTGGNGHSGTPFLSGDGRFVVFRSLASDLTENDENGTDDVFARDLVLNQTMLLSRSAAGPGSANGPSLDPMLSADGRTVVFRSFANDLVPGDYNLTADIFVVRLSRGDSDGDGLEDDWELAYFDSLERDGVGDYDGDGRTDAAEHAAGTDPTDAGSILRVLTLSKPGGSSVVLVWASVPGKAYRVEHRERLSQGEWEELPWHIYATRSTVSVVDRPPNNSNRFYRVRLVK